MTPLYTDFPGVFDFETVRRHHMVFALLNLLLIAALLIIHTALTDYVGLPSPLTVVLLIGAVLLQATELIWLGTARNVTSERADTILTWWPIALNAVLATTLSIIEAGDDHQSFILMVVPVIEAAFRFNLPTVVAIIAYADFLNFFSAYWLQSINEYIEAGATSLIYTMAGLLVWLLVNNLRRREELLKRNIDELNRTRERLSGEEKLSAVGRLSSAIAHEIRNPVAMISSSLATALRPGQAEEERRRCSRSRRRRRGAWSG
jgi:signal transduction histidine kinase